MNHDDIRIIKYYKDLTERFGHWIFFQDRRSVLDKSGKKGRRRLIQYFETIFGPLGDRWQYSHPSDIEYILKLDSEQDLLLFLLKYKK